jgi:hypothetical protein
MSPATTSAPAPTSRRTIGSQSLARTRTRADQAAALERWADAVEPEDLRVADTDALRAIGHGLCPTEQGIGAVPGVGALGEAVACYAERS